MLHYACSYQTQPLPIPTLSLGTFSLSVEFVIASAKRHYEHQFSSVANLRNFYALVSYLLQGETLQALGPGCTAAASSSTYIRSVCASVLEADSWTTFV